LVGLEIHFRKQEVRKRILLIVPTTSLKGGGKQKRTLFDLPIKIREDVQDDCSNDLTIQLLDRYEEIHGMEKDTCTIEMLEEMDDDEID
jgi:hypothetical protein